MKYLIKQYLEQGISRRTLMRGLGAAGLTGGVAKSLIDSLTVTPAMAQEAAAAGAVRPFTGSGGAHYMQQLKAAGVKYVFFNPSTGDAPFYDALVDIPEIQLIKGIQEGAVVAMADGYARLSGNVGVAHIANVGLPNGMTQLVNSFKDNIPVLLTVAAFGTEVEGRDYAQDYEHQETMMAPITKNWWLAESTADIADVTRRVLKFATTAPTGPVFLSIPDDLLRGQATAQIYDGSLFNVAMKIRPDRKDIETVAKMLIEAKNPLLSVGDEITMCHAEAEVVQLAEMLGLAVCGQAGQGNWSKPFPTRNPLYIGAYAATMRFPGAVDVHINIGDQGAERTMKGATLISMRRDPTGLARVWPVDLGVVCDIKLGVADLIAAVKSMATGDRLKQIANDRTGRVHDHSAGQAKMRQMITADLNSGSSIKMERLGVELENGMDKDTIYVSDCDSGRTMDPLISWGGGGGRSYISTGPNILGWGIAASTGAKLAQPDRPVVSCVGDGSCLFGGPQPLWSQARYKAPITNIVVNNRSYNNERNRIWSFIAGQQFKTGKDMTCYNGSPDVDFAKTAQAFGVEGEVVADPNAIKPALARAKKANIDGRPYLLDVHVDRDGVGAEIDLVPAIFNRRTAHAEGVIMRQYLVSLAIGGIIFGAALSAGAQQPQQASPFPDGPGKEIVSVACTQCHGPNVFTQLRMNEPAWRAQIYDMILRGAQIGPEDIDTAAKYMATAYGPGVPFPNQKAVEVSMPDGQGKELVQGGCALCHGLDRVVATKRPKDQWQTIVNRMIYFGAPVSSDQATTIVDYLATNFSPATQAAAK